MNYKVEVLERGMAFDDFFKIEKTVFKNEQYDGTMSEPTTRLTFVRGDSAAVLLYDPKKDKVILVEQFRWPVHSAQGVGGWILETVAGMIDDNRDAATVTRSEIIEEAGYEIGELQPISIFYVSPGGTSERIVLFYAEVEEKVSAGGGLAEEHEDIRVLEFSLDEATAMIEAGSICDAKTIVALQWLIIKQLTHT